MLRTSETRTLRDVKNELNLPMTDQGTPTSDLAYGFVCSAPGPFGVIVAADEPKMPGQGYSAIHPQPGFEEFNDSWWGMYNYPSSDTKKWDYFFLFNPHPTALTAQVDVYDTGGTLISSTAIALSPRQSRTIYPQDDLGVGQNQQNIGLHLTAPKVVSVNN